MTAITKKPPMHSHTPAFHPGSWHRGPGSLRGADTSMWEGKSTFEQSIRGAKWSAIKASEGTGWVDPTFKARWNELGKKIKEGKMKLRVAYQFMHAGNGVAQARHFLNTVGVHGKLPAGTRLCLDWESGALSDPRALHDAAKYIHKVTGVWPMVYVQGSEMGRAKAAVPHAPIWEAAWGGAVNRNVPFFQYSDGPRYDHDVFNGNVKALEKFAGWA
jgi:GH25 family lysozyme M1 (1,4-beta-N-acetylmuramidase)